MKAPTRSAVAESVQDHSTTDQTLFDLVEQITDRLQRGQPVNIEQYAADYPQYADPLAKLLPALEAVEQISRQDSGLSAEEDLLQHAIGDFRIVRELGRGGMGVVYEAEQLSIGRRVALKVLPFAAMVDNRALQRFRNEIRAVGTLDHPNIVGVYFVGEERGVNYYAMQLVRGQSLAEVIAEMRNAECGVRNKEEESGGDSSSGQEPRANSQQLPHSELRTPNSELETEPLAALSTEYSQNPKRFFHRVAELGIQAAEALQHAHEQGIVHRDVKPANLLIDSSGKLYVTDFGLARLENDASMTASGDLLGTLRYMSPEQISGNRATVDHRSDVYSLGATLYELATGVPAFPGTERHDLIRRITDTEPLPPRQVRPSLPHDLETIVAKAIEKDAADRYSTAADLATDLRCFLAQEPIRARRPSLAQRTGKWARRHAAVVFSIACILLVAFAAAFAAAGIANHEREQTLAASLEKDKALQAKDQALQAKNRALVRAENSLGFAITTVDDLYTTLAVTWIADETAPSGIQEYLLNKALAFYQEILRQPPSGNPQNVPARVYSRVGALQQYLGNATQAGAAYRESIELVKNMPAEDPSRAMARRNLPWLHTSLVEVLLEQGDTAGASEASTAGLLYLNELAAEAPASPDLVTAQADYHQDQAALYFQTDQLDLAESAITATAERIENLRELEKPENDNQLRRFQILRFQQNYLTALLLLRRGDTAKAREEADEAIGRCRFVRTTGQRDARGLVAREVDILRLLGEISEAEGSFAEAAAHYREALDLLRSFFKAHLEPADFIFQTFLLRNMPGGGGSTVNEPSWDGQLERGPFVNYIETQLRLARVLRQLGRPYEAEHLLGKCALSVDLIWADRPDVLRYHVADANSWAMVAELFAESHPTEAEAARKHATLIWQDTLARFPHAASYRSGVHGPINDFEWFQRKLEPAAAAALSAQSTDAGNRQRKATRFFESHATGRIWQDIGQWQNAIAFADGFGFKTSAAAREGEQAHPWLHLAICHASLGEHEQAREWFDKANDAIQSMENPHAELIELREQAQQVLRDRSQNAQQDEDPPDAASEATPGISSDKPDAHAAERGSEE